MSADPSRYLDAIAERALFRRAARDAEYRRLHALPHGVRMAQIEARRRVVGAGRG